MKEYKTSIVPGVETTIQVEDDDAEKWGVEVKAAPKPKNKAGKPAANKGA